MKQRADEKLYFKPIDKLSEDDFVFIADLLLAHSKNDSIIWKCTDYIIDCNFGNESVTSPACVMHSATFVAELGAVRVVIKLLLHVYGAIPLKSAVYFSMEVTSSLSKKRIELCIENNLYIEEVATIAGEIYSKQTKRLQEMQNNIIYIPLKKHELDCMPKSLKHAWELSDKSYKAND